VILRELMRALWRNRLARLGAAVVALLLCVAAAAPLLAPHGPEECELLEELAPVSAEHWFGADADGCDTFSRVIWGSRISLEVGVVVVAFSTVLGVLIGLFAGYFGGWPDRALTFVIECFQAFPGILLAIAITAVFPRRSIEIVILALCVSGWVGYARLVRGQTLALREAEYITAARALGMGPLRIMLRQILPNLASPVIVQATFGMAAAILAEAGLSFLGLGAPPGTPSWGGMLNEGRQFMLTAPHLSVFPGAAIMVVVLGFNFLGDGLRDALDPRRRSV
jgi:peptide/nickel transport system permease protein